MWDLSPATAKYVTLRLRAVVEERPTEQNGHCVATCEVIGSGVFGSVGPSAAVAIVVSNPCHVPLASACPMSPLAKPRNSSESTCASTLWTHFFSFRAVTQQSPIKVRSARRRIALNCNRLGEMGAFANLLGQEADEKI